MGKLAGFSYREIIGRLKSLGLGFHRQAAGSHEIWFNPALNRYTTIPNHPGNMPEGTLRAVLKQAGVEAEPGIRWVSASWRRAARTRLEAITSRPKLLSAVGRMTSHAGQKKILLTITHEAAAQIKALGVRHGLQLIAANAPQLPKSQQGFALVRYIVAKKLTFAPKPNLGLTAVGTG